MATERGTAGGADTGTDAVSKRELLASCVAANAVSTPPREQHDAPENPENPERHPDDEPETVRDEAA
jgi:hypothetical protein